MKRVDITDEAKLSGYGDPVGEATHQLRLSLAKIDQDIVTALGGATLTTTDTKVISYEGVRYRSRQLNEEDYVENICSHLLKLLHFVKTLISSTKQNTVTMFMITAKSV